MAKTAVSQWSTTAGSNTDIGGINLAEGMFPDGLNNSIRELMAQIATFTTVGAAFTTTTLTVNTSACPDTNDGAVLGTSLLRWSDLFLATGGVISFGSVASITEVSNALRFGGNVEMPNGTSLSWGTGANSYLIGSGTNGDTLNLFASLAMNITSTGLMTLGGSDVRIAVVGTNAASAVTVGGTQTLTNKTLTSPAINTATITGGTATGMTSVAATAMTCSTAGVGATSVVTVGGTQTLTNKTMTAPTLNTPAITGGYITSMANIYADAMSCSDFDVIGDTQTTGHFQWGGNNFSYAANWQGWSFNMTNGLMGFANAGAVALALNRSDTGTSNLPVMSVARNGTNLNAIFATPTVVQYNTASDYRLKENVEDMSGALLRLDQLRPINFTWISDPDAGVADGFLAHEVQAVVPAAVGGEKDGEDMQGLDHAKLVPLLTGAVKELLQMVAEMQDRITVLEAR